MSRSILTFTASPVPCEPRKGPLRERTFSLTDGSPALVRERLDIFAVAFLHDARPGLLFECGRLAFANDAARSLLGSTAASDSFLQELKVQIGCGVIKAGLLLRTRSGVYAPVLHPARSRSIYPICLCVLVRESETISLYEALSKRELGVLMLLVKGLTNGQIAEKLGISIETVRKHISHSLEKTGPKTRTGLVGRALGALRT
jgi:DNA-binding CsgD family transcriptional regulator